VVVVAPLFYCKKNFKQSLNCSAYNFEYFIFYIITFNLYK